MLRRTMLLVVLAMSAAQLLGGRVHPAGSLAALPPGLLLPVVVDHTVVGGNAAVNDPVTARVVQRVLLPDDEYLRDGLHLSGRVVASQPGLLSFEFAQLTGKGQSIPVHVRLVAAASSAEVWNATLPLGVVDRGTSSPADWTTRQIGGDEIYRSAGTGGVYDAYGQKVGFADFHGVYADPAPGNALAVPLSVGPFSSTAKGVYGMPGVTITLDAPATSDDTITLKGDHARIASGDALLVEVVR